MNLIFPNEQKTSALLDLDFVGFKFQYLCRFEGKLPELARYVSYYPGSWQIKISQLKPLMYSGLHMRFGFPWFPMVSQNQNGPEIKLAVDKIIN